MRAEELSPTAIAFLREAERQGRLPREDVEAILSGQWHDDIQVLTDVDGEAVRAITFGDRTVELDAATSASGHAAGAPSPGAGPSRRELLLVTDNAALPETLRPAIDAAECALDLAAPDASPADQLTARQPALVLLDLGIAGRVGWTRLEQWHDEARGRGVPIIVLSDHPTEVKQEAEGHPLYQDPVYIVSAVNVENVRQGIRAALAPH